VLTEDLVLGIGLVKLLAELTVYNVGKYLHEGNLIRVLILNCLAVLFHLGFLAHGTDSFVVGLNGYTLYFSNGNSIDGLRVGRALVCSHSFLLICFKGLLCEEAGHLGLHEAGLLALILSNFLVVLHNFDGSVGLAHLVLNSLDLVFFHLAGDSCAEVFWAGFFFVTLLLELDLNRLFVDSTASENGVYFKQELVSSVGSAVDYGIVVFGS
jgi:hypothetical protein